MTGDAGGWPGGAGDSPCGAGKGGNGRRRGRLAWRRGRFALRRAQGRQRPATRAIRLAARARAATAGGAGGPPLGAGAKPGGDGRKRQGLTPRYTSMVDPAVMTVDGGNAVGEAHVAHAVVGDGPDVDLSTDVEMYVSLSLAARSARTFARPRWSMGFRSLLNRVCTTFASATALARTLGVSTSQFPVSHHSDEGSGRPAWPMVWDLCPSHLLIQVLGFRNMRVWR